MAHKPQSYRVEVKKNKKGEIKKILVLYEAKEGYPEIIPSPAEQKQIDRFIADGYEVRFETKNPGKTVAEMREELNADAKALAEFNKLYAIKDKENPGFHQASKFYNEWKKAHKE